MFDNLLLMTSGMPRSTEGEWLLWWFTYNGVFPGFMYGLYDDDLRSSVMSRLLTHSLLASMVIFKLLSLKTLQIRFLMFSISRGDFLEKMSNRERCIPGHSNRRRQPTERSLRRTHRGSI